MTELITALCQFHLTVGKVTRNQQADRYRYAGLADVLEVIRQPLLDAGLVLTQTFEGRDLITTLWHTSGEALASRLALPEVEQRGMNTCQALGSAISYCRRYAILSILGLATEDNDGASVEPAALGAPF